MNGKLARAVRKIASKNDLRIKDVKRMVRGKPASNHVPVLTGFYGARKFPWRTN